MNTDASGAKVAIVTGAAQGIGEGTARLLVERGYCVSFVDRNADELVRAVDGLDPDRVLRLSADVSVAEDMNRVAAETLSRFGRIDALHSNAGIIGAAGPLRSADPADFDHVMAVNVRGGLHAMQAVLPTMLEQKSGSIVFTASTAGLRPSAGLGVYSVSKYALVGLTKNAAADLGPAGIRVNAVAPGLTDTPAFRATSQRSGAGGEGKIFDNRSLPLGRVGTPEEVGEAVCWLFSDAARYVTGVVVNVDGGIAM